MDRRSNPVVSIIVPARNEEACLSSCLESLVAQTGIDFEIIVVDDASTDRTPEIARSFEIKEGPAPGKGTTSSRAEHHGNTINGTAESRALPEPQAPHGGDARSSTVYVGADALVRPDLHVIPADPLPDNWTGKNNAMTAGAKVAKGKWLLFTDADTVHKPGSLARAVAEAEQRGAALLSYSPEQEVRSFWEKAVMPVIFAELAATYPPAKVNDPVSPIAAANGQYLLISREAYDAVGGHTKIAADLLEDVAMARLVKSSGRKIFFRYGGDAVRTRMYRSFAQMKEGWTKNLALLFPKPVELAQRRFGEFVLLLVLPWVIARGTYWRAILSVLPSVWVKRYVVVVGAWAFVAFILSASEFLRRMRKAHFSWWNTASAFFGLPIFAYLLLRSEWSFKRSRFDWKDRTYIYTPDEVRTLSAARLRLETPGPWRKLTARIWNHGDT
jgi:glycosyltransferase involved in cell wall biosynthesis